MPSSRVIATPDGAAGQIDEALKAQGIPLMNLILPPATMFLRIHDPKAYGDDLSPRRPTVVEANKTGKPIVGVEQGRDMLANFAITPIMRDGKSIAVVDVGAPFGKEFVDRAKKRFGIDLAVHRFDGRHLQDAILDLRRPRGRHARTNSRAPSTVRTLQREATPRRPSGRALSRPDQELHRRTDRGARSRQGHHRI